MKRKIFLITTLPFLFSTLALSQTQDTLQIIEKVDVYTDLAREPMFAEHPDGSIYLAGFRNQSKEPQLWRSNDKGKSWKKIDVGRFEDGADGNSDVDLKIDENGTIYFVTMKYTRFPDDLTGFDFSTLKGEHIAMGVSKDKGENWEWQYLSQNDYDDRPWIEIDHQNNAHIIWNDGNGIYHRVSADQGLTWDKRPDIYDKGGSSHFAISSNGKMAVRIVPLSASGNKFDEGVDLIRISSDGGKTWKDVSSPADQTWEPIFGAGTPRWVEPLAWDDENNLYYVWSEGNSLKLGITSDSGDSWDIHEIESSDQVLYFPYVSVNNNSVVCSWVSGAGDNLKHHAALIQFDNNNIRISKLQPQTLNIWTRFEVQPFTRSTGGEYFPIKILSDGTIGMATTIHNRKENKAGFTWWILKQSE